MIYITTMNSISAIIVMMIFFSATTTTIIYAQITPKPFTLTDVWFQCEFADKSSYTVKDLTAYPTQFVDESSRTWTLAPNLQFKTKSMVLQSQRESSTTSTRSELRFPNMVVNNGKFHRFSSKSYLSNSELGEFTLAQLHLKPVSGGSSTPPLRIAYEATNSDNGMTYNKWIWAVWRPPGSSSYTRAPLFAHPGSTAVALSIYIDGQNETVGIEWSIGGAEVTASTRKLFPITPTTFSAAGEYYFKTGVYCSGSSNWIKPGLASIEVLELNFALDHPTAVALPDWFLTNDQDPCDDCSGEQPCVGDNCPCVGEGCVDPCDSDDCPCIGDGCSLPDEGDSSGTARFSIPLILLALVLPALALY